MKELSTKIGTRMLFLDIETTGLNPETCDIIEIGALSFVDNALYSVFRRRIKPTRYIPLDVQGITGISNKDLQDCEPIESVLPEFIDFCSDFPIYGYNLDFDYRFLCFKSRMLGFDFTLGGKREGVDVLKVVRNQYNMTSYKLGNVAQSLGLDTSNLHSAYHDASLTKQVYDKCMSKRPELLDKTKYGKPIITDTLDLY